MTESPAAEPPGRPRREHLRRALPIVVAGAVLVAAAGTLVALHSGGSADDAGTSMATGTAPTSLSSRHVHQRALPPPAPLKVLGTSPAPGTKALGFGSDISVRFSTTLARGSADPTFSPQVAGTWALAGPATLVFRPAGYFVPLSKLILTVPAGRAGPHGARGQVLATGYEASFTVAAGSMLRLQQLLAELDYLPLRFESFVPVPPKEVPRLPTGTISLGRSSAALSESTKPSTRIDATPLADEPTDPGMISPSPEAGSFSWGYANIPASLASLWQPGRDSVLVQGAVMAFESAHGLDDDADLSTTFWADLFDAVAHRQVSTGAYDYIEVSTNLPETLSVWQDGKIVFQTPANTGIPEAPTQIGTFPVYARYYSTTMSGYNPDGSYYDDPGIPDVAYFNGGDAVHGFLRGSYGFPQSLGCVELPYSAAPVVFNYDPIGTLVNIA
jgi:hypothetical protein